MLQDIDKSIVFNTHSFAALGAISPSKSFCLGAMDDWAAKVAVDFGVWLWQNAIERNDSTYLREIGQGKLWHDAFKNHYTTEELYNQYLQTLKQ